MTGATTKAARLVVMMIRPPAALVLLLFAAIGMAEAGDTNSFHPLFTLVPLIVGGWFVNATVLNDLGDEAIDRINLQDARGRPLVAGAATRRQMLALGGVAGTVALGTAAAVDWRVAAVIAGGLVLSAAYSLRPIRLSDRGPLATALLPVGYVALPYLVGVFLVKPSLAGDDLLLLGGLYIAFMGRIVLKDFRDVRGDAMYGKRTFLVRYGRAATCRFSAACWAAGSSVVLVLFAGHPAVIVATGAYLACALRGLRVLSRGPHLPMLHKSTVTVDLRNIDDSVADQVVIGAIAEAGRGMAVTVLAHITMVHNGWTSAGKAAVIAALTAYFVGLSVTTLAQRSQVTAESIRPY